MSDTYVINIVVNVSRIAIGRFQIIKAKKNSIATSLFSIVTKQMKTVFVGYKDDGGK